MAISSLLKAAGCGVCLAALGCGGNSTDCLIVQLQNADPKVRQASARALGNPPHDVPAAVAALTAAVSDPDYEVREEAAQSLGQIGAAAKSSLVALEGALRDRHRSVRTTAALAIYSIDTHRRSYVPVLCRALQAGDGPVFLEVAQMGSAAEWAVPTLTSLLSHKQPSIRALAAKTLGGIGAPAASALSSLQLRARDNHAAVRKAARIAIERIASTDDEVVEANTTR